MALTIMADHPSSGFLILGVPVAFAIGLSALCTILYEGLPVAVIFQQMMSGMNIFSFLAIPFFVFSGELMLHGGIADKIVAAARTMVGHIRGGLGMSNVVACTLFGGVAGSPVADVSAMGAVMIPMMKREGYHADYAVNVTTHAALVGALMPTSHNMIIYALAASGKASIGWPDPGRHRACAAALGVQPGRRLLSSPSSAATRRCRRPPARRCGASIGAAVPGLLVLVIILGGIVSGIFTATEVRLGRGDLLDPADLLPLPHDDLGELPARRPPRRPRPRAWCCCSSACRRCSST